MAGLEGVRGVLEKKGRRTGVFQKRFFVVATSSVPPLLQEYHSEAEYVGLKSPSHQYSLDGLELAVVDGSREFELTLPANNAVLRLRCDANTLTRWTSALREFGDAQAQVDSCSGQPKPVGVPQAAREEGQKHPDKEQPPPAPQQEVARAYPVPMDPAPHEPPAEEKRARADEPEVSLPKPEAQPEQNEPQAGSQQQPAPKVSRQAVGAAAVGALAGAALLGPVAAVALGAGAAYATTKQGQVGDVARASGNLGVAAGERAQQTSKEAARVARQADDRFKIAERAKGAAQAVGNSAKAVDQKFHVVDHAKAGARKAASTGQDFARKLSKGSLGGAAAAANEGSPEHKGSVLG